MFYETARYFFNYCTEYLIFDMVERNRIEVILFLPPSGLAVITTDFLKKLKRYSRIIYVPWDMESNYDAIDKHYARVADLVIVVSGKQFVEKLKASGISVVHTYTLFDPELYRNTNPEKARDIDVIFIGNLNKGRRKKYVDFLRKNGIDVKVC